MTTAAAPLRAIPALASSRAAVEASATVDHAAASSAHSVAAAAHAVAAVASDWAEQHLSLFSAHRVLVALHGLGAAAVDIAAAADDVVVAATVLSTVAMLDGFNEADHPREDDGKFTDAGGGGGEGGGGKSSGGGAGGWRFDGGERGSFGKTSTNRRESNVGARDATAKAGKAHDAYRASGSADHAKAAVEAHQAAAAAHREAAKQSAGTHETAHHNTAAMHEKAAARVAKEAGLPEPKTAAPPPKADAPKTEGQDKPAAKPAESPKPEAPKADPKPAAWHEKETPQAIAQRGQAANAATERAVNVHTPEAHREAAQVNHDAAAHLREVAASAPPKEAAKLRELADIRTELAKGHERVANEAFGPKGGEPKAEATKPAAEQDKPKGDDAPAHDKPAAGPVVVPVGGGGQDAGSKPADAPPGEQKPADAPPKAEEPKAGKGQDDKPAAKPASDTRGASKHEGPGIAAKMAHLMAMLAKVTAELLLMHKHPSLGGKITGEGYTPPKGKSSGAPKSDAAKGDPHAIDAAKAAAAAHTATKKAEGATSATATEAHKAAAKAHDEAAKAERASAKAHEKAGDKKSASEAYGRESQHNDTAKSHRDAAGRLERGEPEHPRKHETTSVLDALNAIAMLYSEDQPRDADGRFGSGGGGGAATGEMTPVGGGRGDSTGEMTPVGGRGGNPFAGAGKPMSGAHTRETRDKAERDRQHDADHKHMATEARGLAQRATEIAAERSHRTKSKNDHATHERAHAMNRVAAGAHRIAAQLNPEHAAEHNAAATKHDRAADAHEQAMVRHHPDGNHEAASVAALAADDIDALLDAELAALSVDSDISDLLNSIGSRGHALGKVMRVLDGEDAELSALGVVVALDWDEDQHPRADDGKFGSGSGSGGAAKGDGGGGGSAKSVAPKPVGTDRNTLGKSKAAATGRTASRQASGISASADNQSRAAQKAGTPEAHAAAAENNRTAAKAHDDAAKAHREAAERSRKPEYRAAHLEAARIHAAIAADHSKLSQLHDKQAGGKGGETSAPKAQQPKDGAPSKDVASKGSGAPKATPPKEAKGPSDKPVKVATAKEAKAAADVAAKAAKDAAAATAAKTEQLSPAQLEQKVDKHLDALPYESPKAREASDAHDAAAAKMDKHIDANLAKLSPQEHESVLGFSHGHDYEIRALQRGDSHESLVASRMKEGESKKDAEDHVKKSAEMVRGLLAAQDKIGVSAPPKPPLYRGMSVSDRTMHELLTNDHLSNRGMSSSSTLDPKVAESFANVNASRTKDYRGDETKHRVLFVIDKATKSLPMTNSKMSGHPDEKEMLLRHDADYKITKRSVSGNFVIIHMAER